MAFTNGDHHISPPSTLYQMEGCRSKACGHCGVCEEEPVSFELMETERGHTQAL